MPADPRYRFGPFVLREEKLENVALKKISADVAVFVPSWEARADAVLSALDIESPRQLYLDFAISGPEDKTLAAQISALKKAKVDPVSLRASVEIDTNRNLLMGHLRQWSNDGAQSLFLDVTSLPKAYIQSIICGIFNEGLFARLTLGYAEGRYLQGPEQDARETAVDFGSANLMVGGVSPCREKRLIAVLGGERANCYALIEKVAPDSIHILATRSDAHPEHQAGITTQVEKITSIYSDRLHEVRPVEAFSVKSLLDAADIRRFSRNDGIATSIFVGGTKPHAVASAVLASALGGVDLRFRRVEAYETKPVEWAGRYYLYDVIDLRSPALLKCFPW